MRRAPPAGVVAAGIVAVGVAVVGCSPPRAPDKDGPDALVGPLTTTFNLPDHPGRDFILHLPDSGGAALPVVFGFHGGGGKKEGFNRTTCRDGDESDETCLFAVADREGFAVVLPDGTDKPGFGGRSWHSGGGEGGFRCVGGQACVDDVDDVAFFDDLLDEVRRAVIVDDDRVYATGISNGASMSHRLACDRADVLAAIAPVAGANQAETSPGCAPTSPIPVLHLHGTDDPCWGFDGTIDTGLCDDPVAEGVFFGVEPSMAGWRARNGCDGTTSTLLPDEVADGTTTRREDGTGCDVDTVLLRIEGGGHTWPGGWQYLPERTIGRVAQDFHGNDVIWDFFAAHPRSAR